eukprot:jgi/Mesen1/359/ME000001S02662
MVDTGGLLAAVFMIFIGSVIRPFPVSALIAVAIPAVSDVQEVQPHAPLSLAALSMGDCPGHLADYRCARIRIPGQSRLRHLSKMCHIRRVRVEAAKSTLSIFSGGAAVCFHWNESMPVGACADDSWRSLNASGMWVGRMSPFSTKYLDVRLPAFGPDAAHISVEQEFQRHRVVFLAGGFGLLTIAPLVSQWVPFYYSSGMLIGTLLVLLLVLYQIMKLLPLGRRNSWSIFVYGSVLGVGTLMLGYLTTLARHALATAGLTEDLAVPVAVFLGVAVFLIGAGLGFWIVRRFVLSPDGHLDSSTAGFVDWSLRFVALVMLGLSSHDAALQIAAMVAGALYMLLLQRMPSASSMWRCTAHASMPGAIAPVEVAEERYISSFHQTPSRRKLMAKEVDAASRAATRAQLEHMFASPAFGEWAVANADRIAVTPTKMRQERSADEISLTAEMEAAADGDDVYDLDGDVDADNCEELDLE